MKKIITSALLATIFVFANAFTTVKTGNPDEKGTASTSWMVDEAHSVVEFSVRHFFTPVSGRFGEFQADIQFDPDNLGESRINVTIPVESVNTENSKRDNHLSSEDFFNAEEWPEIRFVSNSIRKTADNTFVARGQLTIRDVTKTIDLPFELLGIMDHPMMENTRVAGFTARTKINRTDFGVGVGDWAATMVVGDEVDIQINLELNSKS